MTPKFIQYKWNFIIKNELISNKLMNIYTIENIYERILFWQLYMLNKINEFKKYNLIIPYNIIANFDYKTEVKLNTTTFELLSTNNTIKKIERYLDFCKDYTYRKKFIRHSPILTSILITVITMLYLMYVFIYNKLLYSPQK